MEVNVCFDKEEDYDDFLEYIEKHYDIRWVEGELPTGYKNFSLVSENIFKCVVIGSYEIRQKTVRADKAELMWRLHRNKIISLLRKELKEHAL